MLNAANQKERAVFMEKAIRYEACAGAPLARVSPEEAGVCAKWVEEMVAAYARAGLRIHSFLLLRDGKVYAEGYYSPYDARQYQTVYSLSKSFTSAAMGLAQAEGILSLDERVAALFADEIAKAGVRVGPELESLTLRHLLRMSTGQPEERWQGDFAQTFLSVPFTDMPGEVFRYNTMATYMCAAALKKRGVDLEAYLQEKLFDPMGIHGLHWMRTESGVCTGGFGLSILPEVIAKFGVLILQDGVWEGKQLLPRDYLRQATSRQIDNGGRGASRDWEAGYGYQFWMCENGSFRGDGMYGQLCVMNRKKNAVLAMTAFVDDIQAELDVYFDEVLSKMQDAPLAQDPEANARLRETLAGLSCRMEPAADDGAPVPDALLRRAIIAGGQAFELSLEGGELLLKTRMCAQPFRASRGKLLCQEAACALEVSGAHLNVVTRVYAGYGMQGGALVVRLFIPEALMDFRLEVRETADGVKARLFDVHNPAKPVEMKEEEA